MSHMLGRETNTITVASFYENYLLKKYNFSPPYQRLSVWTDEKQSFFIDSILKNFPIPPIFLRQHIDDRTGRTQYDVIDGKQRLSSIVRFINNEIPVATEFEGGAFDDEALVDVYFSQLDAPALSEYKKKFWRYVIPIEYIDTPSQELIDNIFDRLNRNGEPLTGQELRNAKFHDAPLLRLVRELAEDAFWRERLAHLDLARMENYEFVSELVFLLLERRPLEALPPILDSLYEKYTTEVVQWDEIRVQFFLVTGFLGSLQLDFVGHRVDGVSHLYGLWCFAWYCMQRSIAASSVREKLVELFVELRSGDIRSQYVREYKKTMSSNTKSKSQRENRLAALCRFCGIDVEGK